jgi:VWFA-related protein
MQRRACSFCTFLAGLAIAGLLAAHPGGQASAPASHAAAGQGGAAALVPVNVRVIDRAGRPVTDLKQSDFTLSEDGVPAQIRHFSLETLTPETPPPGAALAVRTGISLSPQNHRIFLIALGLGRLEEPSKAITGLIQFVRTRLLPQDEVGVFAYDRALAFTTDHEKVAQVLERFRRAHPDIDMEIQLQLGPTGMAALYGRKTIPPKVQAKIDEVFGGPGARTAAVTAPDVFEAAAFSGLSLDDFMFSSAQTLQDHVNLITLMEYLRRFEGEKQVLFVTERWMTYPSDEIDAALGMAGSDARAAIHTLQAGGLAKPAAGNERTTDHQQAMAFRSLRAITDQTGGLSAIVERGGAALDRLDEATRTSYLIGYAPRAWDGAYRRIAVQVNRPDVKVLFRHGYYGAPDAGAFSRRMQITADRLGAAGSFRREVNDIRIKASASQNKGRGGGELTMDVKIDISRLSLAVVDGAHVGTLDVGVFYIDSAGQPVGSQAQTLPVKMTEEEFKRYQKGGFPYTMQFPMLRGTQTIRFVVYDYVTDLIGRADTRVF